MPLGLGGQFGYVSPYWNPGDFSYKGLDYANTPWGASMLEKSPQTAIYRYMRGMGAPETGEFGNWLKQRYNDILQGYNAYTISNPYQANIQSYLGTLPDLNAWQRQFLQQAPSLRGVNVANWSGGPVRWVG